MLTMRHVTTGFVLLCMLFVTAALTGAQASISDEYMLQGQPAGGVTSSGSGYTLSGSSQPFTTPATGSYAVYGGFLSLFKQFASPFDMNGDSVISAEDAIFVVNRIGNALVGLDIIADINGDGTITQADVDEIMQRLGQTVP